MIVYFDTSALLPIVIEEPTSDAVSRLWDEADRVLSSRLVYAEARAALAMARRMDRLDGRGLSTAVDEFEDLHGQLDIVEVSEKLVRDAGELAQRFALRGYDAVHLASAHALADSELVLATGDRDLREAGRSFGLATAELNS